MSCSPFDLRDYFLRELADPQQRQVEAHVKTCPQCREELDRLRITEAALFSARDEEIPQRIAFVSDKVFEPSPWRRGWAAFWGSSARLGFASAAMLAAAIVFYALHPAPAPGPRVATVATAAPVSDAQIQQRVQAALDKAIPEIEARYEKRTEALVKEVDQRDRAERGRLVNWADATYDRLKTEKVAAALSAYDGGGR
jgi:anti-sigma factor RsiW